MLKLNYKQIIKTAKQHLKVEKSALAKINQTVVKTSKINVKIS